MGRGPTLGERMATMTAKIEAIHEDVIEIKTDVRLINGRVRVSEQAISGFKVWNTITSGAISAVISPITVAIILKAFHII